MYGIERQTMHWSAGTGWERFSDYHGNVMCGGKNDGLYVRTQSDSVKASHTWMRNTGNLGKAFDAEKDAHPAADGHGSIKPTGSEFPITPKAIETMAKSIAEDCCYHDLDFHGLVSGPEYQRFDAEGANDRLVATGRTIHNIPVVTDHLWYARVDQYPQDRWDCADVTPIVLAKVPWYIEKLKSGEQNYEHTRTGSYQTPGPEAWHKPAA